MDARWAAVAERAVADLEVSRGEVIQVREGAGRYAILQAMLLAIERRGATPLPEVLPPAYWHRLLTTTDPALLGAWAQHRLGWMEQIDRVLVLAGPERTGAAVPAAWEQATWRLTKVEERRCLPYLVAIPTVMWARQLGRRLAALDALLLPALSAPSEELAREVERVWAALQGGRRLTIRSGATCELQMCLDPSPLPGCRRPLRARR